MVQIKQLTYIKDVSQPKKKKKKTYIKDKDTFIKEKTHLAHFDGFNRNFLHLLLRLDADGTMYDRSISSVSFLSLYSV